MGSGFSQNVQIILVLFNTCGLFQFFWGFQIIFVKHPTKKETQNLGLRPNFPPSGDRKEKDNITSAVSALEDNKTNLVCFLPSAQTRQNIDTGREATEGLTIT